MAARAYCGQSKQVFSAGGRQYVLGGVIGDGAIGIVRRAVDRTTKREVAVKLLAPEPRYVDLASFDDISARFRREGLRGVSLDHPNLVKVLAFEDNDEGSCFESRNPPKVPFIVMEYVRGQTLESFIRHTLFPGTVRIDDITLYLAHQVCEALLFLHDKKLVHRDVKPANIFLSGNSQDGKPTSVKLGDFGVCKWGDFRASVATGSLTVTGQNSLGTMKYMSPEQALTPREVTVRADMYSYGVTLFELFTSQILPSPHHVFQLTQARLKRGSVGAKLVDLGIPHLGVHGEDLFGPILDMVLTGASGRPTSKFMRGRLQYLFSRLDYSE